MHTTRIYNRIEQQRRKKNALRHSDVKEKNACTFTRKIRCVASVATLFICRYSPFLFPAAAAADAHLLRILLFPSSYAKSYLLIVFSMTYCSVVKHRASLHGSFVRPSHHFFSRCRHIFLSVRAVILAALLAPLHKTGRFHFPRYRIWSFGPCRILAEPVACG